MCIWPSTDAGLVIKSVPTGRELAELPADYYKRIEYNLDATAGNIMESVSIEVSEACGWLKLLETCEPHFWFLERMDIRKQKTSIICFSHLHV